MRRGLQCYGHTRRQILRSLSGNLRTVSLHSSRLLPQNRVSTAVGSAQIAGLMIWLDLTYHLFLTGPSEIAADRASEVVAAGSLVVAKPAGPSELLCGPLFA